MLTATDELPVRPRRITVAGVSGSGKSTLSCRIADIAGLPYTEIDSLFHGPSWTPRPEFMSDVVAIAGSDTWVTEWQYTTARPVLSARADLLVWLDLPFWTRTFPQVIHRTLRRRLRREVLWNGNIEQPLRRIFVDPEHIIRWAVSTRHKYRDRVPLLDAENEHLTVVRLTSRGEVEQWLRGPFARATA